MTSAVPLMVPPQRRGTVRFLTFISGSVRLCRMKSSSCGDGVCAPWWMWWYHHTPQHPIPPHHHHHPFPVHLSCVRPAPEQSFNLYAAFCASAFQSIGTLYWKTVASKCIRFKRANLSRLCCLAFSQFLTIRRSVCPQSRQTQRCWPTLRRSPPSLPHTHLNSNLHLSQGIPSQHTHLLPFYLFHLFIYLFIYICSY